jgi:hypothetical protein
VIAGFCHGICAGLVTYESLENYRLYGMEMMLTALLLIASGVVRPKWSARGLLFRAPTLTTPAKMVHRPVLCGLAGVGMTFQGTRVLRWGPLLICGVAISGCADMEHVGWQLASTARPAIMRLAGQQLEGDVLLRPDRTGAVQMNGQGSITSCAGSLRFTAVTSGVMDMRCSDGAIFAMSFALVNEVKGYAFGTYQDATVALAFGMDASEARAYLAPAQPRPPANGTVVTSPTSP